MKTAYLYGRRARERGLEKSSNPYSRMTNIWSWWMAGWDDADISLSK